MVGVVGSSPIEPTNEFDALQSAKTPQTQALEKTLMFMIARTFTVVKVRR